MVAPLPASATSTLVQQASGGCSNCSSQSSNTAFGSQVTSGNLIVVGVSMFFNFGHGPFTVTVTDTLSSVFTQSVNICNTSGDANCASIWYATAPSSGADAITVAVNNGLNPYSIDTFIYELSGLTTTGATTGTGQGGSSDSPTGSLNAVSTTSTSFTNQGFLLGVVNICVNPAGCSGQPATSFTPGTGFTASAPSSGSGEGFAQYSLSGVTSPTTFPGALSQNQYYWVEASLALNTASSPPGPLLVCPSSFGGSLIPVGSTYMDGNGYTWVTPGGSINGAAFSSYFFSGPIGSVPPPMIQGWGGIYGTYGGQQGWIVTFYCNG